MEPINETEQPKTVKINVWETHKEYLQRIKDFLPTINAPMSLGKIARELKIGTATLSKHLQLMYYKKEFPEGIEMEKVGTMVMIYRVQK